MGRWMSRLPRARSWGARLVSLEQPFVQALQEATAYAVDGVSLTITGPAGEMQFSPDMPAMA